MTNIDTKKLPLAEKKMLKKPEQDSGF